MSECRKAFEAAYQAESQRIVYPLWCEAWNAAINEAATTCDEIGSRCYAEYKTGHGPGRADPHVSGKSDGAYECEAAILALLGTAADAASEVVTERPAPPPPPPPPNIGMETGRPWKKPWEKTFDAPPSLTLDEQREAVKLLKNLNGRSPVFWPGVSEFLSRPNVAAMLKGGER